MENLRIILYLRQCSTWCPFQGPFQSGTELHCRRFPRRLQCLKTLQSAGRTVCFFSKDWPLSKWCKNTMTSSRSWMNCTIGCTIFFIYFFCVYFLFVFFGGFFMSWIFVQYTFFYGFLIIAWSMKNCFGFEKLL